MPNTTFLRQKEQVCQAIESIGIEPESLCEFLKESIEIQEATHGLLNDHTTSDRKVNEAKLLMYVLMQRTS